MDIATLLESMKPVVLCGFAYIGGVFWHSIFTTVLDFRIALSIGAPSRNRLQRLTWLQFRHWPCIWFLAAILEREFSGKILIDAGLSAMPPAPVPLGSRCILVDKRVIHDGLAIGIGVSIQNDSGIWGDAHGCNISYQSLLGDTGSGQVQAVPGGTTIQIAGSYDAVFEGLVTYLKKSGYSVDEANKESGLVATSMEISGGWKQTGKRFVFSVIKDKAGSTAVRVAVAIQTRYKGLQVEPWGDPKVDEKASADLAHKVQTELPQQLSQS